VAGIARRAREQGALCVVDGAQAAGHMPVDVRALSCDAYAASGHKGLLGPMGTGVLGARPEVLSALAPAELGGGTILDVAEQAFTLRPGPRAFEGGTPDVAGVLGLAEGARLIATIAPARVQAHERGLAQRLRAGLRALGAEVLGPEDGLSVVSFNLPGWPAHDLALALDQEAIAVRSGHHCALPLARWLGTLEPHGGTVRASFHYYNIAEDVDRLLAALGKLA
ncbi:MAG: aminotransferase class V-fold PLP-dependent enzyme, partial [Halobacteriales archaeon]|nr:aminotransferase class V-fold PLP-dependent enzyme [Halobacteriales archaeon]